MSIIDLNTADIFNAIGGGSPLSIIDSALHPQYVIRNHGKSDVALEFSGMASIQPEGRALVTNAPVEGGVYKSMNKVKAPSIVRCSVIINGLTGYSGGIPNIFALTLTNQSETLSKIKSMLDNTDIYDIETPKETFSSYDLVGHSYEVNSQRGVTMLTVFLDFQEIMQRMVVISSNPQSKKQPTNDKISKSRTGAGAATKESVAPPATVDDLSKSWASLKASLGALADEAENSIDTTFQSALKTVSEPVKDVVESAVQKTDEIVKLIIKNIT